MSSLIISPLKRCTNTIRHLETCSFQTIRGGGGSGWHSSLRFLSPSTTNEKAMIRLSKRMSELDICSRREADRWIRQGQVQVDGELAQLGQQVSADLTLDQIQVLHARDSD